MNKTFLSLRNRNYRLYFIGQLISNTGNWLTNVALTLLVLKITGSGLDVGLLAACQYGPILLFSAWAGAIADRVDKRRMLIATQTLEMLQSIGLAIIAFMPHPSLTWLYILALAGGLFLAFDNPLRRSFVSEMVRPEDVPNAVVLYSTIVNFSRIFGPTLAGLLVVTMGYGWCFTIDAITYIAVLVCLFMMRSSELYKVQPRPKQKGEIREGIRHVMSQPVLWISFVMIGIIGTLTYNFSVTLPLFVTLGLHSTDTVFTILYSIFSCGAVLCALIVAHKNLVRMKHIIWGAAGLGISTILLGVAPGVGLAIPIIFLVGMSSMVYNTASTTLAQTEADPNMRGRVLALQSVLIIGTTPIGGPLCGWMADVWGARSPIILGGIVALLTAIFGYYATKRYVKIKISLPGSLD